MNRSEYERKFLDIQYTFYCESCLVNLLYESAVKHNREERVSIG